MKSLPRAMSWGRSLVFSFEVWDCIFKPLMNFKLIFVWARRNTSSFFLFLADVRLSLHHLLNAMVSAHCACFLADLLKISWPFALIYFWFSSLALAYTILTTETSVYVLGETHRHTQDHSLDTARRILDWEGSGWYISNYWRFSIREVSGKMDMKYEIFFDGNQTLK